MSIKNKFNSRALRRSSKRARWPWPGIFSRIPSTNGIGLLSGNSKCILFNLITFKMLHNISLFFLVLIFPPAQFLSIFLVYLCHPTLFPFFICFTYSTAFLVLSCRFSSLLISHYLDSYFSVMPLMPTEYCLPMSLHILKKNNNKEIIKNI